MSRAYPQPGKNYTVVSADDIVKLASWAYNDESKINLIIDSNKALLKPRSDAGRIHGLDRKGVPIIYVGDVLWIPPEQKEQNKNEKIESENPDEIAIRIENKIFKGFIVTGIDRAINTIADAFSFTASFNPSDPDSKYLDPYTYYPMDLFIGGELFMSGVAEHWSPNASTDATTTTIKVRSRSGVLVDCNAQDKNLSYKKQTLQQIANNVLRPFGILTEFPYGDSGIINNAKRNVSDKVFSFVSGLAKKFGYIVNSISTGSLRFDRANIDGEPILKLIQGEQPLIDFSATYDGTQRFSDFTANSQSRGKPGNTATVKDKSIPVFRPISFDAKDTEQGNIQDSAKWERARSLARSANTSVVVEGWRDDKNKIILENNTVILKAPNIHIYNETKFLIEKVSYTQQGGRKAKLDLVLPQAYTLEFPSVFPWSR